MKSTTTLRVAIVALLAALVLFFIACKKTTIDQILADPHRYTNHEVGVEGDVVQNYSILGRGVYQVDDGTGTLWVVSEKGVPRKGAHVGVKGKIRDGFDLGSIVKLPEVVSNGLVMIESSHKVITTAPVKGNGQRTSQ